MRKLSFLTDGVCLQNASLISLPNYSKNGRFNVAFSAVLLDRLKKPAN